MIFGAAFYPLCLSVPWMHRLIAWVAPVWVSPLISAGLAPRLSHIEDQPAGSFSTLPLYSLPFSTGVQCLWFYNYNVYLNCHCSHSVIATCTIIDCSGRLILTCSVLPTISTHYQRQWDCYGLLFMVVCRSVIYALVHPCLPFLLIYF